MINNIKTILFLILKGAWARFMSKVESIQMGFLFSKLSSKLFVIHFFLFIGILQGQSQVDILVTAGGGGGGYRHGGGGGAGGVRFVTNQTITSGQSYTITVGAGGSGATSTMQRGNQGGASSFGTLITTVGGGGGGSNGQLGGAGGSGGGGSNNQAGGSGTAGEGNNGGTQHNGTGCSGAGSCFGYGAGGGGATAAGQNSTGSAGSDGGAGLQVNITGTNIYYGGGGGGGSVTTTQYSGGAGGGGNGGISSSMLGVNGTVNTGGGGGGGGATSTTSGNGGSGGSGIVIIRYANNARLSTGGDTSSYTSGGVRYQVHTFRSSGTFVLNSIISNNPSTAIQNVCINGTSTALSVTATGTSITYQWYSNTTASNSGGTLISGATNATYTPPTNVAGTRYYYCYVSNSTGNTNSAVSGAIIINTPSTSGTISGANTVSSGTNSTTLTLSGHNGTPQWQSSADNITFANISGATNATYTAINLTTTTHYRAIVTNGGCASITSASTTILVLPSSNPNSTTLSITGSGSTNSMTNNVATVVDNAIVVSSNGIISGFTVSISASYTTGDILSYTGTLPSGVTTTGFNATGRNIVFKGNASAADWQAFLRTVTLQTTAVTCNPESRQVSFTPSTNYYNYFNGHYYEFDPTVRSWTDARASAASKTFFGRQGYLTTITSAAENAYINTLINQNTWIGCTDNFSQINSAVGYTKYSNQNNAEGKWHWVTGPEKGLQIRTGNASTAEKPGSPISGVYQNWNLGGSYSNNEPNDVWSTTLPGQEDYGHLYANSGKWNDFPNNGRASIIEYGDMPGDNPVTTIAFTRNISILGSTSGRVTGGGGTVCQGSNTTALSLTGASGSVARWEYSNDNFLTNTTNISNTTTSYNVTNITETTYYRAIMVNGSCTLATTPVPVYVTPLSSGSITAITNQVCVGSNVNLTLNAYTGTVNKWQISPNQSSTTDISNTTNLLSYTMSSAGTFYIRAVVENTTCAASANSEWYPIDVSAGGAPSGGIVTSAAYCSAANSGVLTLNDATGATYLWEKSSNNGASWSNAGSTSTTLTYNNISQNTQYRVLVSSGSCGSTYSSIGEIVIYGTSICEWTGAIDNVWSKTGNWCAGVVGNNGRVVHINPNAPFDPTLDGNVSISLLKFNNSSRKVVLGNFNLYTNEIFDYDSLNYVQTNGTGLLKRNINDNENFTFAVGKSAFNPVSITNNTGAADSFSVRVYDLVFYNGYNGMTTNRDRIDRTWDIYKKNANSGSGVDFLFNWNYGEAVNLTTGHRLNHYENGDWNLQSTGTTNVDGNSLSYTGYTGTFSPFGIGGGMTMLPIKLIQFNVVEKNQQAQLSWIAQAHHKHLFEISRSEDGIHWTTITTLNGIQNSETQNYQFIDPNPLPFSYYKVTILDELSNKNESLIKTLSLNKISNHVKIYPNPNNGSFDIETQSDCTYTIQGISGNVIKQGNVNGKVSINDLAKGVYIVHLKSDELIEVVKLIIQ